VVFFFLGFFGGIRLFQNARVVACHRGDPLSHSLVFIV
jgi:hypothetical protein